MLPTLFADDFAALIIAFADDAGYAAADIALITLSLLPLSRCYAMR